MNPHPTCIDCGDTYLSTNAYHGYYCPDCHETWLAKQQPAPKRSRRLRLSGRLPKRPTRQTKPSVTRRVPERDAPRHPRGRET